MKKSRHHKGRSKHRAIMRAYNESLRTPETSLKQLSPLILDSSHISLAEKPQPYVLKAHMQKAGIKHDQPAIVHLKNVMVIVENGEPKLYFCPMVGIEIISKESSGDNDKIPKKVTLVNSHISSETLTTGNYDFMYVHLYANSTIQLQQTPETKFLKRYDNALL